MKKSYIKYLLVNCVVLFLFPNFIFAQKTKNVDKYRDIDNLKKISLKLAFKL